VYIRVHSAHILVYFRPCCDTHSTLTYVHTECLYLLWVLPLCSKAFKVHSSQFPETRPSVNYKMKYMRIYFVFAMYLHCQSHFNRPSHILHTADVRPTAALNLPLQSNEFLMENLSVLDAKTCENTNTSKWMNGRNHSTHTNCPKRLIP